MVEEDDDVETEAGFRSVMEDEQSFEQVAQINAALTLASAVAAPLLIVLFIRFEVR